MTETAGADADADANSSADADRKGTPGADSDADADAYRGLPGAFVYAFRRSDSWLFRCYVLVGAALSLAIGLVFALGVIVLVANTTGPGGTLSLSRSFFVLVGLLIVLPIVAPVLLVARRHRRGIGDDARYDRRLAVTGVLFVASVYVGLIVSTPPEQRVDVGNASAPIVEALYALPAIAGLVPPVVAAALIYVVHRRSR